MCRKLFPRGDALQTCCEKSAVKASRSERLTVKISVTPGSNPAPAKHGELHPPPSLVELLKFLPPSEKTHCLQLNISRFRGKGEFCLLARKLG